MADQLDDNDVDDGPFPKAVIAELALDRIVSAKLLADTAAGRVRGVLITVPTAAWAGPIAAAAQAVFGDDASYLVVTGKVKYDGQGQAAPTAKLMVAISQSPDALLPPGTLAACDVSLRIDHPDGHLVRQAAKRLLKGRVGTEFVAVPLSGLDLDEIAACLPLGGSAALAKRRFQTVAERKVSAKSDSEVPTLTQAAGYGQAQVWALDLQRDIADLRAGLIGPGDCDGGAILAGKTGTGKSLFARIVAKSCGLPIVVSSMGELFSDSNGYLHGVMKRMREVFDLASSMAPSLLFIDELDSFPSRSTLDQRNRDYWTPLVNDFLTLLDSANSSREGVIVLGATNNPENLDPALVRPGRFERILHIDPPDASSLATIMRYYLREDLPSADLVALAIARPGATGAEAQEWVRAARRSARRAGRAIVFNDLASQVLLPDRRTSEETYRVAIHEAGHAVATELLTPGVLVSLTIVRSKTSSGNVVAGPYGRDVLMETDLDDLICRFLAGRAAEEVLLGNVSTSSGGDGTSDLGQATNLICMKHLSLGMGDLLLWRNSPTQAQIAMVLDPKLRTKVAADLAQLYERTKALVLVSRQQIAAVAAALVRSRTLTGPEVAQIIRETGDTQPTPHHTVPNHTVPTGLKDE